MPKTKSKTAVIALEAKNIYIPHIQARLSSLWPPTSYLCDSDSIIASPPSNPLKCRFAFYEKDPVDLALDWADPADDRPIPVIMPANERKPGGDWENSVMLPEECLCRRSNLSVTLATPAIGNAAKQNYPIPSKAGIYSANVVFRGGPDRYEIWKEYRVLPVISVCPLKRPKVDSSGKRYSFKQEKEIMRGKIHIALRIAINYRHTRLCIGTFGLGNAYGNPAEEVAILWRDELLFNPEFVGHFQDIVFAFEPPEGTASNDQASSSGAASSSRSRATNQSRSNTAADLATFRHIFKPSVIHNVFK